jgi:3-phenylpropionate/trans-cinnamate dioxygenase ferredoxin reductase subunit
MQEALPLERGFGPVAGAFVRDLLEEHGIEILAAADVACFEGDGEDDAPVTAVVTADGRRAGADLVVVGVGANPDVLLARKAGLHLGETGGVRCDRALRTSAPGVFAAGDICEYDSVVHGRRLRIEHEDVAAAQGRHAARAMLGSAEPYAEIPYFWTDIADWARLEYVGPAPSWDEELVHGDPAQGAFSVWYLCGGRLAGALAVGRPGDLDVARELLAEQADADAVRATLARI